MMLLVGGIPNIYYDRFKALAIKGLRGINFTGVGLKPLADGRYEINQNYCDELLKTLVAYAVGRPHCLDNGLGAVLLRRGWEKNRLEDRFFPFALCNVVDMTEPICKSGEGAKRVANIYADVAFSAARQLQGPVRTLTTIYKNPHRTPLLLPLRHFTSDYLLPLLEEAQATIVNAHSPAEAVNQACNRFLEKHPFTRDGSGGIFTSNNHVEFKTPGRALHGGREAVVPSLHGHDERCFLNSRVRLGGYYIDGFHYDCRRGKSDYCGEFSNCHLYSTYYKGHPHLNVYPDDFIRN